MRATTLPVALPDKAQAKSAKRPSAEVDPYEAAAAPGASAQAGTLTVCTYADWRGVHAAYSSTDAGCPAVARTTMTSPQYGATGKATEDGDGVAEPVVVGVGDAVTAAVCDADAVALAEVVEESVASGVGVLEAVEPNESEAEGVAVDEGVAVVVGVGEPECDRVGVTVEVGVGEALAETGATMTARKACPAGAAASSRKDGAAELSWAVSYR